jgi:hypothetical protein
MVSRIFLALAIAFAPSIATSQTMVCGPDGCTYTRAPVRSFFRPAATVYRPAVAQRSATYSAPRVVYSRGLFGRPVATRVYSAPAVTSYSSGSSGSAYTVQPPSNGSTGGSGSDGGGAYAYPTGTPTEPPAASIPDDTTSQSGRCPCGDDCQCGPDCQCVEVYAVVPDAAPVTGLAAVPPAGPVSSHATLPDAEPRTTYAATPADPMGAIAGL